MVAGFEEITEGEIYIGDKIINLMPPKDRDIAMVFQNYALYPHMTVYNNMKFALKLRKVLKPIYTNKEEIADLLLEEKAIRKELRGIDAKYKKDQNNDSLLEARQALYHDGKTNEILVSYEPRLQYIAEWWKQLYGESEGKDGKGIFPASDIFTTDLHSMGQYIQDGLRNLFETIISVEKPTKEIRIPLADSDLDQLNYIAGKRLSEVNHTAETATILAHVDGGVPNIIIQIPEISASTIGELIYFFEMGCALSGYMLEVNPFDQPGVEAYKKNMFALLGKQGFEERATALKERIK
jgi:glucose-6-phosphate isomerase